MKQSKKILVAAILVILSGTLATSAMAAPLVWEGVKQFV